MLPKVNYLLPKLRFKEFNGEWKKHELSDFLSIPQKEKVVIKSTTDLMTVKLNLGGLVSSSGKNLSLTATNYYMRYAGQFIYGKQNFFHGSMAIIPTEFEGKATSGDVPALDINNIDPNFLYYFLARPTYYKNKEAMALGTGSKRIHEKVLLTFDIIVPNKLIEQQKISTFMNKLDKLIALQEKKFNLLKAKKQYFLQNLFA